MMRTATIALLLGSCYGHQCEGDRCAATQDVSNLIQQIRGTTADDDEDGWSFQNSFVKDLVTKLSPDSVTERVDQIIEDNSISLDAAQDKLYGLAHKFGSRLNKTIGAAQDRLTSLHEYVSQKGHMIKDQSLVQAVGTITALGDAAIDVTEKVTAEVQQGQTKVRQMMALVQSERTDSRRQEMQQSLGAAATTLSGLLHALEDAMGKAEDSDGELSSDIPDVTEAAVEKAEKLLGRTDQLLDRSRVYVAFVQTRINQARDEATELVVQAGNQTDAAFDASNKIADDLVEKLGEINGMLAGNISFIHAKEVVDREKSSASAAAVSLVALCLAAAATVV